MLSPCRRDLCRYQARWYTLVAEGECKIGAIGKGFRRVHGAVARRNCGVRL